MARSFRRLTILLGKLGIAEDWFVRDWDEINAGIPLGSRRLMKSGIEYGFGLKDAVDWTKKYLATVEASTAVTAVGSVGVSEDEPSSV